MRFFRLNKIVSVLLVMILAVSTLTLASCKGDDTDAKSSQETVLFEDDSSENENFEDENLENEPSNETDDSSNSEDYVSSLEENSDKTGGSSTFGENSSSGNGSSSDGTSDSKNSDSSNGTTTSGKTSTSKVSSTSTNISSKTSSNKTSSSKTSSNKTSSNKTSSNKTSSNKTSSNKTSSSKTSSNKTSSNKTSSNKTSSNKTSSNNSTSSSTSTNTSGVLSTFNFLRSDNSSLPFDIFCEVNGNRITAKIPPGTDLSSLVPNFDAGGGQLKCGTKKVISGSTSIDFSKTVTLTLGSKKYTVNLSSFSSNLPSMSIYTKDLTDINSKIEYKTCSVYASGGNRTDYADYAFASGDELIATGQVKGRGWTSWYYYPKKSYTLKLDKKVSILGLGKDKEYVLAANFGDRSLMRNAIAMELAHNVGMDPVMDIRFVDLWVNGKYAGNYQLIEKIEIGSNRVNITDFDESLSADKIGFILEAAGHNRAEEFGQFTNGLDADRPSYWKTIHQKFTYDPISGDIFFRSPKYNLVLNVNKPSDSKLMKVSSTKRAAYLNYIYDYVSSLETALKSRNYSKASQYLDMESMARYYIVNELTMNVDSQLHASCYMYKDAGGKLTMGPLWDFDLGLGNGSSANETAVNNTYLDNSNWFKDLLAMPEFKALVKKVWNQSKSKISNINSFIDSTAEMLNGSQKANYSVWSITAYAQHCYSRTTTQMSSYSSQVSYIKTFLDKRYTYLNNKITNW